jgi:CrcB protein
MPSGTSKAETGEERLPQNHHGDVGMYKILWVGMGGFVGSSLRYALSAAVHRLLPLAIFPLGTLAVNVVGCLSIGMLSGFAESHDVLEPHMRLFLFVGLLGGFTTFSTFGFETFALANGGRVARAAATVLLHIAIGIGAVWFGYVSTRGTPA